MPVLFFIDCMYFRIITEILVHLDFKLSSWSSFIYLLSKAKYNILLTSPQDHLGKVWKRNKNDEISFFPTEAFPKEPVNKPFRDFDK